MLEKSAGAPTAGLPLTWKALPGPENTTPRGELTLKKLAGKLFGAEKASGTPSQLISRRPLPTEPATLGFKAPRPTRNESTVLWILAAFAPTAENTTWAEAGDERARITITADNDR